ncbi:MAG: HD domain-containing protein [Deltaproteobacteria bacterium]|nr:MAG: HD domain-containing protein [Deltaproteobacteria bacterium]
MAVARREDMERKASWIKARLTAGDTARQITARLSDRMDEVLEEAVAASMPQGVADAFLVLAVGGYGRQEMFPHGDIDIVLLYDDASVAEEAAPEERLEAVVPGGGQAVERLLTGLRDAGYRVGLRVRGAGEHRRLIAEDVTVAAASLDGRAVRGREDLFPDVCASTVAAIDATFPGGIDRYCCLVLEGVRHRHAQFGGSAWLLEPQLKTGRGGLRDGHAIRWAARLRFGTDDLAALARQGVVTSAEAEDFRASYEFVARSRLALHALSKWRNDRLAFERQEEVARLMGFGHGEGAVTIEAFMQAFYRHADQLANLSERWLQEWSDDGAEEPPELLDDGFELRGGKLAFTDLDGIARDISEAARLLMRARHEGVHLHASSRSFLRDVADEVDPRVGHHPDAIRVIRRSLLQPAPDGYMLRALLDTGLFARIVPEWRHLVGHTNHDVYHVYTTDRHLFEAFTKMCALVNGHEDHAPAFIVEALGRLQNASQAFVEALLLATLLHDVGKGLDGDHSMIGAGMVAEVARRLEIPHDGREMARWLVLEHLHMVRLSQRRDLQDPATVDTLLDVVPTENHLNALTVLSWADMTSVGPALQSDWKLELLRQLTMLARAQLAGRAPVIPRFRNRPAVIAALESGTVDDDTVAWLEAELNDRQWATFSETELRDAMALLGDARHEGSTRLVRFFPDVAPGLARIVVCTRDRPKLLYALTAGIAAERHNILRARIFTTRSGIALDHFDLPWTDPGGRPLADRRRERLVALLERIADGTEDADTLAARSSDEATLARPHRPPVATEIAVQDGGSPETLLVEVKTRDRIGLLAELARRFSELGFEIERSIIAREGDRAIDTFYVHRTPSARLGADELRADLRELLRRSDDGPIDPA